jgi:hypothetical protein
VWTINYPGYAGGLACDVLHNCNMQLIVKYFKQIFIFGGVVLNLDKYIFPLADTFFVGLS